MIASRAASYSRDQIQQPPELTRLPDDRAIHFEGRDCGPSCRRLPENASIISAPPEMFFPQIGAWIEQSHSPFRSRVNSFCPVLPHLIASRARKAQVFIIRRAASRARHNVIEVKCLCCDVLRSVAVLAAITRPLRNTPGELFRSLHPSLNFYDCSPVFLSSSTEAPDRAGISPIARPHRTTPGETPSPAPVNSPASSLRTASQGLPVLCARPASADLRCCGPSIPETASGLSHQTVEEER